MLLEACPKTQVHVPTMDAHRPPVSNEDGVQDFLGK